MKNLLASVLALGLLLAGSAQAADPAPASSSQFDAAQAFAPFSYQYPVNRYRSSSGVPGPDYWQNRVDYDIQAELDPDNNTLSGTVVIDYVNHSPDKLHVLWLQLDQNRYRKDARSNFMRGKTPPPDMHTQGYQLESVELKTDAGWQTLHYKIADTRMRVDLPQPLAPETGSAKLRIRYHYTIPGFPGRSTWFESNNGAVYEIAYWFPRLCVYDDLRGWDTLPFLNNEFYLEYGDIDYRVTVPADMIVVGSGKLVNAGEVLTKHAQRQLAKARNSDDTVMIRSAEDVRQAVKQPASGTKTWHFHMHDTRDVALAASAAFLWDGARINLPNGKHAMAMSAYPIESITAETKRGKSNWGSSTQHVKYTVEFFSRYTGFDYPWASAIAVGGKVGGMEYPGIVFDWWKLHGYGLFMLAVHEVGHSWFPMIVGSNERRDAWMDEGMNTFVDMLAHANWGEQHDGEFAPKQDGEYAPDSGDPAEDIRKVLGDPDAGSILLRPDVIPADQRHPVTYFKAAYGLQLLRTQILGKERFDKAFRHYTRAWAFKHPSPSDFFRAMDSAAGEDLSWFWRGWFRHNWQFDMAVTGAEAYDDEAGNGVAVTIAILDKLVLPNTLQVTWADGHTTRTRIPVATWMQGKSFVVRVPGQGEAVSATLDPDHVLPDANRDNDSVKLSR